MANYIQAAVATAVKESSRRFELRKLVEYISLVLQEEDITVLREAHGRVARGRSEVADPFVGNPFVVGHMTALLQMIDIRIGDLLKVERCEYTERGPNGWGYYPSYRCFRPKDHEGDHNPTYDTGPVKKESE